MTLQATRPRRPHAEGRTSDVVREEIRAAALAHMVAAVAAADADDYPFPHFIVRGIFPDGLYQEMLASLPDARLYEAFGYEKHASAGVSNRARFSLTGANLNHLLGRQRSLWLAVRDALGSPQFKAAVFERLARGLAYRLGLEPDAAAGIAAYPLPELFRETAGYVIKPHPDTRRKVVTMQIALPADDSQAGLGTEFYRRSWNPLVLLREPRGFQIAKRSPFLPNVAYAFVVINSLRLKSWHGRTTLRAGAGVRNSILNIWYADAKDANPDVVAQYYRTG